MNPSEEQDELWKLLGKASQPSIPPFFARNIVREIRTQRQERAGFFSRLRMHWQAAATTLGVASVMALVATHFIGDDAHNRQIDSLMAITEQVSDSPDFYVINDLDDLLASEENSVWLDNSAH